MPSIAEFRKNLNKYLNELPVEITRYGEVVAVLVSPEVGDMGKMVINYVGPPKTTSQPNPLTKPDKLTIVREALKTAEAPGIPEDPTINGETILYCDRCHHIEDKLIPHWEDGKEFQVCLYCKKKIKRPSVLW